MIASNRSIGRWAFVLGCAAAFPALGQTVITQWNFQGAVAAPDNSPAPTTGSGTAISLGMTNVDTYAATTATNSVTSDDILDSLAGIANPAQDVITWRIRGAYAATGAAPNSGTPTKSGNVNGWNLAAPQYTQGAEFDFSTAGYQNIGFSYVWYDTTQGVRDLQEQYNLDVTKSNGWTNINSLQIGVPNDYDSTNTPTNTIDLTSITGANDDAKFGIRLVSAYDPTYTGAGSPTYTAAALTAGNPVQYNNSSGNWRFGDITLTGTATAVPEPTTLSLIAVGGLGLLARRRRTAK